MLPATRLSLFAATIALLFGGGALAGGLIDPERSGPPAAEGHEGEEAAHPVRGTAVAEDGLRLAIGEAELRRGRTEVVRFRILDGAGATVRSFDVEHTKRMHVIVARRDLSAFQHLHPRQASDGSWSVPLRLDAAGSYRLYADFVRAGEKVTLATDLRVDGAADLRPLPAPSAEARSVDGYTARLDAGRVAPGREAELRFTLTRAGRPVVPQRYLGAGGHLVALREGDMAFLHVHPTDDDAAAFEVTFPTAGRYRLFLQFQHAGRVRTVAFTQEVG